MIPLVSCLPFLLASPNAASSGAPRERVAEIVSRIRQADYAGDREALQRLHEELEPLIGQRYASRVQYWRGFALWRRAIYGLNENVNRAELENDLRRAADEFELSVRADPAFLDAQIGEVGCLGLLLFIHAKAPLLFQADAAKAKPLIEVLRALPLENPRLCWTLGPMFWNSSADKGGQAKAVEMYATGLKVARNQKATSIDPLEPSWGEPELLMSLAWSKLNQSAPDVDQAERYAREALQLVPAWHYVRDILLPQIESARRKDAGR
jgi:hypothetical protein